MKKNEKLEKGSTVNLHPIFLSKGLQLSNNLPISMECKNFLTQTCEKN